MKKVVKDINVAVKWQPYKYQKKAIDFLIKNNYGALFLDPGLGKTSITLSAINQLKKDKKIRKVLIIAPLLVCYNVWPQEICKWQQFNNLNISIVHGKYKLNNLHDTDADIYVINYEAIQWLFSKSGGGLDTINRIRKFGFDLVVFDELSKMKNTQSQRFKKIRGLLSAFKYRWGLTGSPAANGLMDLFGECYVLDGGAALGKYITHYRMEHFMTVDPKGVVWVPTRGAQDAIFNKIKHLALRMKAEDYLDMPDIYFTNIYVDLDTKTRALYDEMEKDLIIAINDKYITAASAAVASSKCRQICSGAIYTSDLNDSSLYESIHDLKIDALINLIEELQGQQLLIAYEYAHEYERIVAALKPYKYACINSGGNATRESVVKRWNAGDIDILIGQPQAMGHGLNLQGSNCAHVCWFTPTWNFELYDQFNRRIYRQGNNATNIIIHHIIMRNTIDEVVLKALQNKDKLQTNLFNALKDYAQNKIK